MIPYINIHTHHRFTTQNLQVVSLSTEEWKHTPYSEKHLYSVGIHPWHSNTNNLTEQLEILEHALQKPNVIALGEVGLDRSIDIPLLVQEAVLKPQIELAKRYSKPIVLHVVRSISDIFSVCKREKVQLPLIFHGFIGKEDTVLQIQQANGYASFGARILENRSWDEAMKKAYDLNCLFFETDEAETPIEQIYQKASEVVGVELPLLKEKVYAYFCSVFKK